VGLDDTFHPIMIVALASPRVATSIDDGLERVKRLVIDASGQGAEIVCFPEAYVPGLRGQDFEVPAYERADQERVLAAVADVARSSSIAVILGMEHITKAGRQIAAFVIDSKGALQGFQTKNQLDPSEDRFYIPGTTRQVFEVNGVKFGIAICHEAFRYPETVRWAATRGAKIVFHPQLTGAEQTGVQLTEWCSRGAPYYEKAIMCRGLENTIYFATVNYALRFQEAATALITPAGEVQAHLPYGEEGVLVERIDVDAATGLLAARYAPGRYQEATNASQPTIA
jgi:predicted amidohydrolase